MEVTEYLNCPNRTNNAILRHYPVRLRSGRCLDGLAAHKNHQGSNGEATPSRGVQGDPEQWLRQEGQPPAGLPRRHEERAKHRL